MINKLKILGEYVYQNEGDVNPLNLKTNVFGAYVICLDFSYHDNQCEYKGIYTIEEYNRGNMEQFMFVVTPSPSSTPPFPSWSIAGNISTALKKIRKSLASECGIKSISDYIDKNKDSIINDIEQSMDKDKPNHILTVRVNNQLIGDSGIFSKKIMEYRNNIDKAHYYMKSGNVTSKSEALCYFCNEKKTVYGYVNLNDLSFYSANEYAYIAGGFRKDKTWKNYPVCPDCIEPLKAGKNLVENHFAHNFWGNDYFIIPTPVLDRIDFMDFIEDMKEEYHQISLRKENATNDQQSKEIEEDIFECLARHNDTATITFFFYYKKQKKFQILQEAEDILPSRFQRIIEAKKKVEANEEFRNLKGLYKKGEVHDLSFNFGIVKTFFPSNFNNDFLDITTKILKGQPISRQFIIHQISEHLARGFRQEELYHDIEKAMIFLKFLYELNLIEQTKGILEVEMKNKYEDYFRRHPDCYNADWKKAVFLTGVLAQHVMDIQYRERNATPFRSRLNGLKLDHRAIKRLLPESIEKLEQYKSNYYRDLEEVISKLMESGEPELRQQSVDEISFYFAMGLNLNKQFKSKQETEGEDNE